jgi:hypothetical protein
VIYLNKGKETELCAVDGNNFIIEANPQLAMVAEIPALTVMAARKPDDEKTPKKLDIDLWHRRLGHLGLDNVRKTAGITRGVDYKDNSSKSPCEPCSLAKPVRHTRKVATKRVFKVLGKIRVDTFHITPRGYNGHLYGVLLTDEFSTVKWGYTFKKKNEAYDCIKKLIKLANTQWDLKIRAWRMDGRREYSLTQLKDLCDELGSILEITTPHSADQDSRSERAIRTILERVRSVMIDQDIPAFLWPEIFLAMVMISNRVATSSLDGITPYEEFMKAVDPDHDHKPFLGHLRVLGCKTYVLIPKETRVTSRKVDRRAEVGILVGYEGEHIYRVWIPSSRGQGRIVRSSNVRFDENGLISNPSVDEMDTDITISIQAESRGEEDITQGASNLDLNNDTRGESHEIGFEDNIPKSGPDDRYDELRDSPPPRPTVEDEEFFDFSDEAEDQEPVAETDEREDEVVVPEPVDSKLKRPRKVWNLLVGGGILASGRQ